MLFRTAPLVILLVALSGPAQAEEPWEACASFLNAVQQIEIGTATCSDAYFKRHNLDETSAICLLVVNAHPNPADTWSAFKANPKLIANTECADLGDKPARDLLRAGEWQLKMLEVIQRSGPSPGPFAAR